MAAACGMALGSHGRGREKGRQEGRQGRQAGEKWIGSVAVARDLSLPGKKRLPACFAKQLHRPCTCLLLNSGRLLPSLLLPGHVLALHALLETSLPFCTLCFPSTAWQAGSAQGNTHRGCCFPCCCMPVHLPLPHLGDLSLLSCMYLCWHCVFISLRLAAGQACLPVKALSNMNMLTLVIIILFSDGKPGSSVAVWLAVCGHPKCLCGRVCGGAASGKKALSSFSF